MSTYTPTIGLEIHVELATKSKMFCSCPADWFGKKPNTHTCPVCLGLPGALPVANEKAIEWTIKIAQALNCTIPAISKFDRKHYVYPDLPKSFQLSQYDEPIGQKGSLSVHFDSIDNTKSFGITRVHLEEDAGKLIHKGNESLVDYNRSGVPLVEIVTEPDFHDSTEVKKFLEELHTLIRALGVSDANMEEGSMRLEPNISVGLVTSKDLPPYKVEVKNINSFKFAKNAIDFEVKRHIEILEKGEIPVQETRGYVEKNASTVSQRIKEEAQDYRYFPEPDIPPLTFSKEYIEGIKATIPELPSARLVRYVKENGVSFNDAYIITRSVEMIEYFEKLTMTPGVGLSAAKIASMLVNKRISIEERVEASIEKIKSASAPIQTDQSALQAAIDKVTSEQAKAVGEYKAGKETVLMFLVGMVMKEMKGQADANTVKENLLKSL